MRWTAITAIVGPQKTFHGEQSSDLGSSVREVHVSSYRRGFSVRPQEDHHARSTVKIRTASR